MMYVLSLVLVSWKKFVWGESLYTSLFTTALRRERLLPSTPALTSRPDSRRLCMPSPARVPRSSTDKCSAQEWQLHLFVALEMPEDSYYNFKKFQISKREH